MAPPVMIDPADRLSRLPEEIQAQILSFLPAQEAVRTCVLARAWRHVWKSTRRLLITESTASEFVDHLLLLRLDGLKRASLNQCEIMFSIDDDDTYCTVNRWIDRCLKCQVQALLVQGLGECFYMIDVPLVSRHLTSLELSGLWFECFDLNLDGCPALEHLEINECLLDGVRKIMSPSLERLVITECYTECCSHKDSPRFKISASRLISLRVEASEFRAPVLESMPELVDAHISIHSYWDGSCFCNDPMECYHVNGDTDSDNEKGTEDYPGPNKEGCVLFEGLAQAKHLVLLADDSTYIFRRDLRFCPTFSNLKTLVVNGYWCEPADCRALACILEHAPVLEKLTALFSEKVELEYEIVWEGRSDTTSKSTMTTPCLKTVNVKCHSFSQGVQNVLKFLRTLNIWFQLGV